MTLEEYNRKHHYEDPFALGKSIFTLEPIPDYDLVPCRGCNKRKKKLIEE